MPKTKNILFITHHNNDLDHFLPLAVHLKKNKEINVKMIAFFTEHELLKNKLHKYICDSNDINFDSMIDVMHFGSINKAIFKIYKYAIMNRGLSNPIRIVNVPTSNGSKKKINLLKNTLLEIDYFFNNPKISISKLLDFIFIRYVVLCSIFFVTKKKMLNYIDLNNIDLVIIDHREIEQSLLDLNPLRRFINVFIRKAEFMNLVLFRFTKVARDMNIPIFMMPHGPQPILKPNMDTRYKESSEKIKAPFRPDFLALCNKSECSIWHHMNGIQSTLIIGDPRYDTDWIDYLESCALNVYGSLVPKPKDKIVLLYLMDIFVYDLKNNGEFRAEMHKDILSMVNHFPNMEIWVKHHPRNVFEISVDDFIKEDKRKCIKQFGNGTDTNILLAKADICLAASSTTLISPILQKRPVIFYNKWKKVLPDATSIYDNLDLKASSEDELIIQYEKIIKDGYMLEDSFLKSFCENVFSLENLSVSMVEKYSENVIEMMKINSN